MSQYQVEDRALERLKELLAKLKYGNRNQGYVPQQRVTQPSVNANPQRSSGISALRDYFKDWSMQQSPHAPYAEVGLPSMPAWGLGRGQAPTIYGDSAIPVQPRQQMPEPMPYNQAQPDLSALQPTPQEQGNGPMNDAMLTRALQTQQPRNTKPSYDYNAVAQFAEPAYTEGPNKNIQDDSRARAIAWALAQQQQ